VAQVPPGAVLEPVLVSYQPLAGLDLPPDRRLVYRFELDAWRAEQPDAPAVPFARPVTVTVTYEGADVAGLLEDELRLVTWDEEQGAWTPITATLDVATRQITARLWHFSQYGLEGQEDTFFLPRLEAGQVSLFSGDSSFSYDLQAPSGAGGLNAPLSLRYDGAVPNGMKHGPYGDDNSDTGWVGVGWTFDIGKIEDGALTMDGLSGDLQMMDAHILPDQYTTECDWDGTHCSPGLRVRQQYRSKKEEFAYIVADQFDSCTEENAATCCNGRPNCPGPEENRIEKMGTFHVWAKDGTHYTFGSQPYNSGTGYGSRLDLTANDWRRVYEVYLLDTIVDPHGNRVEIQWKVFPKTIDGRVHLKEAYPAHILYTTNSAGDSLAEYDVEFVVVAKDFDIRSTKRIAATGYQLSGVMVWYQPSAGAPMQLIRRYELIYDDYDSPQFYTLRRIRQYDKNGSQLPETVFNYYYDTSHQIGWKTDDGWEHKVKRPFLNTVENGYGGVLSFETQSYCLPEGHGCAGGSVGWGMRQRVGARTLSAGLGTPQTSAYSYENPAYKWNPSNPLNPLEEFIGFGQATEEARDAGQQAIRKAVTLFYNTWYDDQGHPDDPKKGKILETWVGDPDGSPYNRKVHTYDDYADEPGSTLPQGIHFVYLSQTIEYTCDNIPSCQSTKTTYAYDPYWQNRCGSAGQYGDVTRVKEYGSATATTPYRTTLTGYCPNTTAWIVDKPAFVNVYAGDVGDPPVSPDPNQCRSSTWYIYSDNQDTPPANWSQAVGNKGELRGVRRLLQWSPSYLLADTRFRHDTFGNVTHETVYTGYGTDNTWATANPGTTRTDYDSTHHTFPTQVTGPAVGTYTLTETREYYGVYENGGGGEGLPGQLKRVRDVNNDDDTWYQYDGFGRLRYQWRPGETHWNTDQAGVAYEYNDTTRRLYTRQRDDTGSSPTYLESWQFYDGLGRPVQSQSEGRTGGEIILADTHYNAQRLPEKATVPQYWPASGGAFQLEHWNGSYPGTATTYDALGRPTLVTNPDVTSVEHAYDYLAAYGWRTRTWDENDHLTVRYSDPFGRLVRVHEVKSINPLVYYATEYVYDERDNLVAVYDANAHDAQGNRLPTVPYTTTMEYDMLGRKTAMDDPDMGEWIYGYDAVGNLTGQKDANLHTISFAYDALNRLTLKDLPGGTDVNYSYDSGTNGAGRRTSMSDGSGSTTWTYDDRGRVTQESKVISGSGTFVTQWGYDAADRVKWMKYPGGHGGQVGEQVNTTYNAAGWVNSVAGTGTYVGATTYDALGQFTRMTFGNGKETRRIYRSDNYRLQRIESGGASDANHQYLAYSYDSVGNVAHIEDWNAGSPAPQAQVFTHDALDRLLSASATGGTPNQGQYSETYTYDAIGNLTSKAGVEYKYQDADHRHAVTHLDGVQKYWYDANGNMTTRKVGSDTYTHTWDNENRLTQVKKNGSTVATFVYDGDGVRVKGTVNSVTTAYAGSHFEWTGSTSTMKKYYYAGGQRVAMRQGSSTVYWLLGDHLGSTALTANSSGGKVAELRYKAWGETRYTYETTPTSFRYTGQRQEESLGIYLMGARWYDPYISRWISPDTIVSGVTGGSGGALGTLDYDDQVRLTPLTVGFHETRFLSVVGEENREVAATGFWFQRSEGEKGESKYQWGPSNAQALNRYSYCLGNPLRYADPNGHAGEPPEWLQDLIVIWRNPPSWVRDLLFVVGRGTRIIQINGPHQGAEFWHVNSDLRMLQGLDHANLESCFQKLTLVEAYLQSAITTLAEAEWLAILERIPVIIVPEFLIDPEYWLKQWYPELFEETQS